MGGAAVGLGSLAALALAAPAAIPSGAPTDAEGYVTLPGARRFHASCVYKVAPGAVIDGATVKLGGASITIPPCTKPARSARREVSTARAADSFAATAGVINGWIESVTAFASFGGHRFHVVDATLVVPPRPAIYTGQTVGIFSGLEGRGILQPAIIFGPSAAGDGGNGDRWYSSNWFVNDSPQVAFISEETPVYPGERLVTNVFMDAERCAADKCLWYATTYLPDSARAFYGLAVMLPRDSFWFAHKGALEGYNITSCAQLPATSISFTDVDVGSADGANTMTALTFENKIHSEAAAVSCGWRPRSPTRETAVLGIGEPAHVPASGWLRLVVLAALLLLLGALATTRARPARLTSR